MVARQIEPGGNEDIESGRIVAADERVPAGGGTHDSGCFAVGGDARLTGFGLRIGGGVLKQLLGSNRNCPTAKAVAVIQASVRQVKGEEARSNKDLYMRNMSQSAGQEAAVHLTFIGNDSMPRSVS